VLRSRTQQTARSGASRGI